MLQNEIIAVDCENWLVREAVSRDAAVQAVRRAIRKQANRVTYKVNGAVIADVVRLYKYHGQLTWLGGNCADVVEAENVDAVTAEPRQLNVVLIQAHPNAPHRQPNACKDNTMNTRVKAVDILYWLDQQCDDLHEGLRNVGDAERLYDYWDERPDTLGAYACFPQHRDHRIAAIGYDPLDQVADDAPIDEEIAETVAALNCWMSFFACALARNGPGELRDKLEAKHAATLRALERIKSTK